jgi:hypothetical protein
MPIQAPQWTEFLSCPICRHEFDRVQRQPISLACGHTLCKVFSSFSSNRNSNFDPFFFSRHVFRSCTVDNVHLTKVVSALKLKTYRWTQPFYNWSRHLTTMAIITKKIIMTIKTNLWRKKCNRRRLFSHLWTRTNGNCIAQVGAVSRS